jgi:hypothetical protein
VAWSYYSARRRAEAFQTASEAWAAAQRVYGKPETEAYSALHLVARKHSSAGDISAGERLLRRAVEVHLEAFGPQHPSTFRAEEGLAAYLHDAGIHLEEAERMYRESVAGRLALYGDEHESPQWVRRNLALLLEATGRLAEAWAEFLTVAEKRPNIRETHGDMDRLRSKLPLREFSYWASARALTWRWTDRRPPDEWREIQFDDSRWVTEGGVGGNEAWARCQFELSTELPRDLRLVLRWPGRGRREMHVNGEVALREQPLGHDGPRYGVCSTEVTARFRPGLNVLALRFRDLPSDRASSPVAGVEFLVSAPDDSR